MELLILRHGVAVPRGSSEYPSDGDRPLTPEGTKGMRKIAKGMRAMDLAFDRVFSSPLVRTKQTAEIALRGLRSGPSIDYTEHLQPDGDLEVFIGECLTKCAEEDRILIVGHEPYLSGLTSFLVCGDDSLDMNFRKGGLCKLSISSLRVGKCATLEWFLTPGQIKDLR
ncbi:MAG: sixA [Bacteroidetes bacterium]|jgi:phosphohistidine phosphatase|nr:sixA [Bacteroidota bacterium]